MKVRFSDAILASHRINQRDWMQKYTYTRVGCGVQVLTVSSFWLWGHLFLTMKFISEFVWVNLRWNGPTWKAKTIISCFSINSSWKERTRKSTWSEYSAREPISVSRFQTCDQSASQECQFPTPKTNKPCYDFACIWPTALKLGYITNFYMLFLVTGFISLVDEIQFMLISRRYICIKSIFDSTEYNV